MPIWGEQSSPFPLLMCWGHLDVLCHDQGHPCSEGSDRMASQVKGTFEYQKNSLNLSFLPKPRLKQKNESPLSCSLLRVQSFPIIPNHKNTPSMTFCCSDKAAFHFRLLKHTQKELNSQTKQHEVTLSSLQQTYFIYSTGVATNTNSPCVEGGQPAGQA